MLPRTLSLSLSKEVVLSPLGINLLLPFVGEGVDEVLLVIVEELEIAPWLIFEEVTQSMAVQFIVA